MKSTENEEKVLAFLQKSPNVSADAISAGTSVFKLTVHKIMKALVETGKVDVDKLAVPPVYSYRAKTNQAKENPAKGKKAQQEENGEAMNELPALNAKGRDTSKLKFQGQEYPKGQTVLAVIRFHVEKNPRITLAKLKEQFPDELQPRYGIVQELSKAKKLSADRPRFFLKPDQLLAVEKKKIAVCSQWGANNLKPFLKIAKSLNYIVK